MQAIFVEMSEPPGQARLAAFALGHDDTDWEYDADARPIADAQARVPVRCVLSNPHVDEQLFTWNVPASLTGQAPSRLNVATYESMHGQSTGVLHADLNAHGRAQ